jgi:trehalose/maltose hydrolase-like predicted phosphorylase
MVKPGWILVAVGLVGWGCNPAPTKDSTDPKPTVAAGPTNLLTVTDPLAEPSAWLSNGLVGLRINRRGDGEGEPMFLADGYATTGEEKILPMPSLLHPIFKIDGSFPKLSELEVYEQVLDTATGDLKTKYRWNGHTVGTTVSIDPTTGTIQQKSTITPAVGVSTRIREDYLPATEAEDSKESPFIDAETGRQVSFGVRVAGTKVEAWRRIEPKPGSLALQSALPKLPQIDIEGDPDSERYARSLDFYLRQSVNAKGTMSVAPMGLSSDHYSGHIFWDADIWVFPALALLDPARAKAIPNYRIRMQKPAMENFNQWMADGRPYGKGSLGVPPSTGKFMGVKYPWESSVSGKETVPGPSKYQDHITGSIAWSLRYGAKLGLVDPARSAEITRLAGLFYLNRMSPTGLLGTMSPDENHIGDNDLYTNILANECIDTLESSKPNQRAPLPKDATSFLTYDKDPVRGYKQAAAVLAIYPLQYPPAEKQASVMLDRFVSKVSKNGPAMSDSVHATILARLGRADEAYELWKKDRVEFADQPLMMFSEKRSKPVTYFVTGAGGWMQTLLYGFLGLRIDDQPRPKAAWQQKLKSGAYISAEPHLPSAWKKLAVSVVIDGVTYRATATGSSFQMAAVKPAN